VSDKNLQETVRDVIGERQNANSDASNQSNEAGISKSQSGDTQSGGTPDYVAGVDISDVPEQDRPRIRAKLESKLKLLEAGYTPRYQKVANLEKSLNWLSSKGLTAEKAEAILIKSLEQGEDTKSMTGDKKSAVGTLEKLISEAPYEQKEALQNMRKIILEETNADKLNKKIEELEGAVRYLSGKDRNMGEQQVERDLVDLEKKFGKEVISKYREAIKSEWAKYPNATAKNIMKYVVPDEEYEQALLSKSSRKTEKTNAITNTGGGVTSSTAQIDIKKTGWKDLLSTVIKEKRG
jgi:hypothetical protein